MTIAKISLPLLGAVAIACAAGMLMSQSGQISPAAQISVPRQCVVNICQLAPATGGQLVQIPPGGHYVVRTVPNDMWLTISQMEVVKDDAAAAALIAVGELHNGALTPKCAFTAQIGSMKLREEIDATRTMGLDPVEVLALPRVIALVLMVPVLGFIASMMGLLGGGLVLWLELGMSPAMYVERLHAAAEFWDGAVAFVKAPFFGLMIALIGCFEGLKVSGSAESVGQRTTASVVEGIFTVIVVDAVFSILFLKLGI